jgi:hypothetical protein
MDRRTALATAGAVALTALAGATAIAANVGILGRTPAPPHVGDLSPIAEVRSDSATSVPQRVTVETIVVDEPLPTTTTTAVARGDDHGDDHGDEANPPSAPGTASPTTVAPRAATSGDDGHDGTDDSEHVGDDHGHASHPEETEPVEGADDDD